LTEKGLNNKLGCRKLRIEELYNSHSSPNIIRMIKSRRIGWVWHVANISEKKDIRRILVVKPEGKRPLGRRRCR
jgi:hypothetical protein